MKAVVHIGGVDYEVDPLPIGIIRKLDMELADTPLKDLTIKEREAFFFNQTLQIIVYGLQTKNPAIDMAKLETIPSNMQELFKARDVILRHAGLLVDKAKPAGEEKPAAS